MTIYLNTRLCQGDCDGDGDCTGELTCFQRDGTEAVPGCSGSGNSGWDYCVSPAPKPSPPSASLRVISGATLYSCCPIWLWPYIVMALYGNIPI